MSLILIFEAVAAHTIYILLDNGAVWYMYAVVLVNTQFLET